MVFSREHGKQGLLRHMRDGTTMAIHVHPFHLHRRGHICDSRHNRATKTMQSKALNNQLIYVRDIFQ